MSETKWRECDDPEVLAAAVAAGVEVQVQAPGGRWVACWPRNARSFAGTLHRGLLRFRIPAGWSPDVPPADDLRERRVWTCKIGGRVGRLPDGADAPMRRAVAGAFAAVTGCPVEFCFSGWGGDLDESELAVVEDREPDPEVIRAALVKRLTALPDDASSMRCDHPNPCTPPAPPWPGAVLSGLTDEDGEPTWLAQAGQVRGEQVRKWASGAWRENRDRYARDLETWVEVRAPRAVPEPETERVPWWDAVGDERLIDWMGDPDKASPAKSVGPWNDCPLTLWSGDKCSGMLAPVAPDGTVEVLRDGGR